MNRIEEMKKKLHELLPTTEYKISDYQEESFKWASNYQADIQYLLSKLRIAENEFNKIHQLTHDMRNPNESIIHQKAEEAIKQLRED